MLFYIIRLDDACPQMNIAMWDKTEQLLDKYQIKPIVGIIPESRDDNCKRPKITNFWSEIARRYQDKGWIIAQHGCHHTFRAGKSSEFKGLSYAEQMELLITGNQIMRKHRIMPEAFFAPKHSFDDTTVDVCRDSGLFKFISDGFALFPYRYRGMLFYPSLFDTPYAIFPFGIFTFVYHPDNIEENMLNELEKFILKHREKFAAFKEIELKVNRERKRNPLDLLLGLGIATLRSARQVATQKKL